MHDMLDDISMPNQSMTISNLSQISQSPFRGGLTPTRSFQLQKGGTVSQSELPDINTIGDVVPLTHALKNQKSKLAKTYANQTLGVHSSSEEDREERK